MERGRSKVSEASRGAVAAGLGWGRLRRSFRQAFPDRLEARELERRRASDRSSRSGAPQGEVSDDDVADARPEPFRELVERLQSDVRLLSVTIGERNDRSPRGLENLDRAAEAIEERLRSARLPVRRRRANDAASNIEAVLRGGDLSGETVVVGAHYDCSRGSPGADDNASGVAVLLALARSLQRAPLRRTVRLVAFAGEQPPHAGTDTMGSVRYVRDIKREGLRVSAMISLASLGLYSSRVPWPFRELPVLRSDLLLLGDRGARSVLERAEGAFDEANTGIRVMTATFPLLFADVRPSDHWSFAKEGVPALMVTDTAPLWANRYRGACDTADRLDYERLGLTSLGVACVVRAVANA